MATLTTRSLNGRPASPRRASAARLTAMDQVKTPKVARWSGRVMLGLFVLCPVMLAFLPWQQSFHATGKVIALDPTERQQDIEAPIDGRISAWYVREGDAVKQGQKLVTIQDPDPQLPQRLKQQKSAVEERKRAAEQRKLSYMAQTEALKSSRDQALTAAKSRLEMAKERKKAADQALAAATAKLRLDTINFTMERDLQRDGLTSQLMFESAKARQEQSAADKERAVNSLTAAAEEVKALEADIGTIKNNAEASIASALAMRQSAEAEIATANRDLHELDIRIARQDTQEVTSPCDGVVFRIVANAHRGGTLVKSGDRLAVITPTIENLSERDVELYLDGNDAPQLMRLMRERGEGAKIPVRIQFEGWPAIQFVGWPSVAWGTFGGHIVFVDPHDDGKGRFRVLVKPDEDDEPWPDAQSLRQGSRAQGWVLLDRVSLWYELWRRFNGFPPVVSGKDKDDGELKVKPGKVKVPK
jgi:multidrug efflux pump subunit AcrA (membrane-fusion protein)